MKMIKMVIMMTNDLTNIIIRILITLRTAKHMQSVDKSAV